MAVNQNLSSKTSTYKLQVTKDGVTSYKDAFSIVDIRNKKGALGKSGYTLAAILSWEEGMGYVPDEKAWEAAHTTRSSKKSEDNKGKKIVPVNNEAVLAMKDLESCAHILAVKKEFDEVAAKSLVDAFLEAFVSMGFNMENLEEFLPQPEDSEEE